MNNCKPGDLAEFIREPNKGKRLIVTGQCGLSPLMGETVWHVEPLCDMAAELGIPWSRGCLGCISLLDLSPHAYDLDLRPILPEELEGPEEIVVEKPAPKEQPVVIDSLTEMYRHWPWGWVT